MWSTLPCSVASSGGSGLVRVIAGGEELTAPVKRAASVRERARGGGEMEEELTADPVEATARPGRGWSSESSKVCRRPKVGDELREDATGLLRSNGLV